MTVVNWWIFTFIMCTLYRGGLTAVLTIPAYTKPIDTIPDLEASKIPFGMMQYGDTYYDQFLITHSQVTISVLVHHFASLI